MFDESDSEDIFLDEQEKENGNNFIFPSYQLEETNADLFLDSMSLVFGKSGSGKTTIVKYIMNTLKDYIPNFVAVTPESSKKFYTDFLPASNVWSTITEQDINNIVNRQEDATNIKEVTHKLPTLHLIHLLISPNEADDYLINLRKRNFTDEQCVKLLRARLGEQNPELQKKIKHILMNKMIHMEETQTTPFNFEKFGPENFNIYTSINRHKSRFKNGFPPLEIMKRIYNSYCYIDLNHRFCLIIDDMTENLKTITNYKILPKNLEVGQAKKKSLSSSKQENIFLKVATRSRHIGLSVIVITHVFKVIEKDVRTNFRTCLFTTQAAFEEAMIEINPDCASINRQEKIAEKVYSTPDEDGNKFIKILYDFNESGIINGKKLHLKTMKATGYEIDFIKTTEKIDRYINKHGGGEETLDFNF